MNRILDNCLVGLVLIASAGYVLSSLGPRSLRRRLLAALSRILARAPRFLGLGRAAQWFAAAAVGKAQGACGGCDDCGPEQAPAPKSSSRNSPAGEVSVPVANIGRRARGAR
jgi:hypothetical protein